MMLIEALKRWLDGTATEDDKKQLQAHLTMTPAQAEEQRRSFAYGNTKLSNEAVTREMVDEAADKLSKR